MKRSLLLLSFFVFISQLFAKDYDLVSPNGKIGVVISVDNEVNIQAFQNKTEMFAIRNISLDIEGKDFHKATGKVRKSKINEIDKVIYPEIKEKYKVIKDHYKELELNFKDKISLQIRAYDNGVAYRFSTTYKEELTINSEQFKLHFDQRDSIIVQRSKTFNSSYETPYEKFSMQGLPTEGYFCLPALVEKSDGSKIVITESDLVDYPGTWLKAETKLQLRSANPGYPESFRTTGSPYGQGQVAKHANYIAKVEGTRNYPWRIFAMGEQDADLLKNTLVYQLASPCQIEDVSWIEPGVVTFDWWGRRNIFGVDFKSGMNTATAKYFIDFCAEFGFEYFLFDDTWSDQGDLMAIHPDLNMEEVMAYAKQKEVKVMLWAIWNTFKNQEEEAWELFEKWGISGIKFDFMNRDDQDMVQFYHHVSREAAKRKMVIDFHGAYKPAGLRRMYPNVLTREGLIEFEYNGWTSHDTPKHRNILPYLRMLTGPMDYIPYTTHNATKKNFRPVGDMPMGMGTRAHSMALFVVLESPMQMLPDSPSDYYKERECTEFISQIPTVWDDLKVLEAKVEEHTVLARKNGDNWYIGAITNWQEKSFNISFNFLDDGEYEMSYIEDGINADTRAIDYKEGSISVNKNSSHKIELAPGGGWLAIVKKLK